MATNNNTAGKKSGSTKKSAPAKKKPTTTKKAATQKELAPKTFVATLTFDERGFANFTVNGTSYTFEELRVLGTPISLFIDMEKLTSDQVKLLDQFLRKEDANGVYPAAAATPYP